MAQQKTMATCPESEDKVRKENLKGHVDRVHKKAAAAKEKTPEQTARSTRPRVKDRRKVSPWPAIGLALLLAVSSLGAYAILTQSPSNAGGGSQSHGNPVAVINVNHGSYSGTFRIELRVDVAPITANNFIGLANRGFYNGLTFHRISSNPPVVQGGDPNGDGSGGSGKNISWEGTGLKNVKYSVAMARGQSPDSATSQFYINTADNGFLDNGQYPYVVFGMVTEGRNVIDYLKSVPVDVEAPRVSVVMTSVVIQP